MRLVSLLLLLFLTVNVNSQEFISDTLRIYYPVDITKIGIQGKKGLDSLSSLIKRNKKASLSIISYADYLGTNPHNDDLSVNRSLNVRNYLLQQGVDSAQIRQWEGKGALPPGVTSKNQNGIPFHRRTDVIITWPVFKKPPEKKKIAKKDNVEKVEIEKTAPLNLDNLKKGDQIVLRNLNFEGGEHILLPESYPILDELTHIMKVNPTLKIEIQGHICCDPVSADGYDGGTGKRDLSYQRAKVVYDHLVKAGIDPSRMTFKGYGGKHRLIEVEQTELDRRLNRRVEIKVLSK